MRADLLALTSEAVASLSNVGLVKRALRELEAGTGPVVSEEAEGTVHGTFPDGARASLLPGKGLKESPCSCGASGVCRHRVALALAYPAWHRSQGAPSADSQPESQTGTPPTAAAPPEPWSPGEINDAQLLQALGAGRLAQAEAAVRAGLLIHLEPGVVPAARLPTCTVRFLVPRDVAFAKCDCVEQSGCAHVALAIWAFRARAEAGLVELGGRASAAFDPTGFTALLAELLTTGSARLPPLETRFAQERLQAAQRGHVWLVSLLEALEQGLEAWRRRSALHDLAGMRALVVEGFARVRAVTRGGELPARYVLGSDERADTLLDHARLLSLGARLTADGESRTAELFLADPDAAGVLLLRKHWEAAPEVGEALGRKGVATRISLHALAHGQVVSRALHRRADRRVEIASARAHLTSITPQSGDWSALPAPLRVDDVEAHLLSLKELPPPMLRARLLAESVRVVPVAKVVQLVRLPAEQRLVALLEDRAGNPFEATLLHRSVAPHALASAAAALQRGVRFVSGELSDGPRGPLLELLGLATAEGIVVPDLAGPCDVQPLPTARREGVLSLLALRLQAAFSVLDELLLRGLGTPEPATLGRLQQEVGALRSAGLEALARRFERLHGALAPRPGAEAVEAWVDAALRATLLSE